MAPLILSRYEPGMDYGSHVDDALMHGVRTDVSFTLFLSDPESYDGGALRSGRLARQPPNSNDSKIATRIEAVVDFVHKQLSRTPNIYRSIRSWSSTDYL